MSERRPGWCVRACVRASEKEIAREEENTCLRT
jgi:hypothetical protein